VLPAAKSRKYRLELGRLLRPMPEHISVARIQHPGGQVTPSPKAGLAAWAGQVALWERLGRPLGEGKRRVTVADAVVLRATPDWKDADDPAAGICQPKRIRFSAKVTLEHRGSGRQRLEIRLRPASPQQSNQRSVQNGHLSRQPALVS
jgi:hypothetical protein